MTVIALSIGSCIIIAIIIIIYSRNKKPNNAEEVPTTIRTQSTPLENQASRPQTTQERHWAPTYSDLDYYVFSKGKIIGPLSLDQILNGHGLTPTTLVTTNTLNGSWFEAQYFECFDKLFEKDSHPAYSIAPDGTILR